MLAGLIFLMTITKKYINGPYYTLSPDLSSKVIQITGGTSGFGRECVYRYIKLGARVIFTGTNIHRASSIKKKAIKLNKDAKEKLDFQLCDFTELSSVEQLAKTVLHKEQKLDILQNNVGTYYLKKQTTIDGNDALVQVNHQGSFLLTSLLMPQQLKTPKSRVIQVSCTCQNEQNFPFEMNLEDINIETRNFHWYKNYAETKLYNIMFTKGLKMYQDKLRTKIDIYKQHSVKTVSLDPGLSYTGMIKKVPYIAKKVFQLLHVYLIFLIKPALCGAQHLFKVCLMDHDQLEDGEFYANMRVSEVCSKATEENVKKLWNTSVDIVSRQNSDSQMLEKQ